MTTSHGGTHPQRTIAHHTTASSRRGAGNNLRVLPCRLEPAVWIEGQDTAASAGLETDVHASGEACVRTTQTE